MKMNLMEGKERKKSNPNIGSATDDPTKWSREPVFSKASPYDYDESSEDENGAELLARIQRKKSERQEILDKSMSLSFSKSHSNSISISGNGCSLDESAQMLKAHDQGLINSMNVVSNQNAGFSKSFNTVTQQQASSVQNNGQKLMVSQSDKNINIGPLEIHSDNNSHNSSARFNNTDMAFPTLYLPGIGKSLSGSYSNSDVENSPRDHEKSHFLSDKSGENTPKRSDLLSGVAAGYVYNGTSGSNSGNNSNNDRINHNNISINSANSSRKNSNSSISLSQIPSHPHSQGATTTQPKQARSIQRVVSVQSNNTSGNSHIHNYSSNNSNVGSNHYTSGNTSGSRSPIGPMGTADHFANSHTTSHTSNHISHRDKLNKVDKLTENAQLNPSADIAKLISIGLSETEAIKVYNEHVNALNNQNKNAHIAHSNGCSNSSHIAHNNINNSNSSSINYPTPLSTHRDSTLSIQVPSIRNPIDSYLDDIPIVSAPVPVNRNLAEERQAHEQQYRSHQNRHNHSSGRSLRRQNTDFNPTAAANALNDINSGNNNTVNSNNSNNTTTNSYNNSDNRVEYRGDSNSVSTSSSRRSSKNNNVINQNMSNNSNSSGCGGGSGSGSGTVSRPYTANNIESVRINSRYNLNAASGSSSNLAGEYYIAEQSPYHSRKNSLTHNMNSTTGLDRMLSQSANNTPRGGVSAQIKNVIAGNEALTERDLINMSMNSYGLSESEWDSGSNNSSFYSSFSQNSNANTYNNNQLLSAAVQYANHNRSMSSMNNLSPHSPHPGHGIGFNTSSGRNSNLSNQDSHISNNSDDNSPPRIRLSHSADEMAFQLGLLLSKQDAAFGINMFSDTNLIESNEVEINAMMSAGYAKEHAIQMIFERIYGTCE